MQNFSETFLKPVDGAIVVPTGDGAEAFIDAEDIAAVAAATLADPDAHAGAQYAVTGPEAPARPSPTLTLTATPGSPAW